MNTPSFASLSLSIPRRAVAGSGRSSTLLTATCAALFAAAAPSQQPPLFRTADPAVVGAGHGVSLTGVGDLNGNGWNDFVVGEPGDAGAPPTFPARGGAVWVYDGLPNGGATCPCGPSVGGCMPNGGAVTALHTIYGASANDNLGVVVLGVDDVNGDGVRDLLVTRGEGNQVGSQVRNGAVLLYSGAALGAGVSTVLATIAMPPHFTSLSLQSQWFGHHLQAIGDWNQDGVDEVLIGAPMAHDTTVSPARLNVGMFEVHDLVAAASGSPSRLARIYGKVANGQFGTASIGLDDLTGDGVPDFAVGAPFVSNGGTNGQGQVLLYTGGTATHWFTVAVPTSPGNLLGSSFSAFDQNGDGVRDLAVGEPGYQSSYARVRIFDAAQFALGAVPQLDEWRPGSTVVNALSGLPLFDTFGSAQANMGDLDGDGVDDILVGSFVGSNFDADNPNGMFPFQPQFTASGAAYLMSGAKGAVLKIYSEACSNTAGQHQSDNLGYAVANVGDLDRDGLDDLGIGAPGTDYNGVDRTGVARFYPGAYEIGVPYGTSTVNSTGTAATITATGSASLSRNTLQLIARNVPGGGTGQFIFSDTSWTGTPFYQGYLWIQTPLRLPPLAGIPGTGAQTVTHQVDLAVGPAAQLALQGGFLYFQYWFIDPAGGRNLSNAVRIGLLP